VIIFSGDFALRILLKIVCSVLLILGSTCSCVIAQDEGREDFRWFGHDFAFCFVTDDGRLSNLAWADTAQAMDFRFTLAINSGKEGYGLLSGQDVHELNELGFEIAQHGYSHGFDGLPESCPMPPRGSLAGYFLCEDLDEETAMEYLAIEIERDSIASFADFSSADVLTTAYPRHRHTKALIDSLISEGYIGARMGSKWDFDTNSFGDFTEFPRNGWEEGISLFRIPIAGTSNQFFGDHSATPPVHFTYEEFRAAALPKILEMREAGGIMALYTHHLGDDDDSLGDINYGSGGITQSDLAWMVDLVRDNGGVVLTLREAIQYYRARATMQEIDGDYVWLPNNATPVKDLVVAGPGLRNYPNPFNPQTWIQFHLDQDTTTRVTIIDLKGRVVANLANEILAAGEHSIAWGGLDGSGSPVPAGVYFVSLTLGNGENFSRKILLLK
jgi:hypothetical protein